MFIEVAAVPQAVLEAVSCGCVLWLYYSSCNHRFITPYRDYLFVSAVDHTDLSKAAAHSGDSCAAKTKLRSGLMRRKMATSSVLRVVWLCVFAYVFSVLQVVWLCKKKQICAMCVFM